MANIGVLGSGTWGTALAIHLAKCGHAVTLWSAFPAEIDALKETHRHKNLPGALLPETMCFTAELPEICAGKDLLILAVPSIYTRETARKMRPFVPEGQIIVNVAKGIEEGTLKTQSDITEEEILQSVAAVLSGPSHAEEVSVGMPTAVVAASRKRETALYIQELFMNPQFRVYISPDMQSVEVGGSLKNVIALAAGMADGLGYGDNTMAALVTRGITELARLGMEMGGSPMTFYGLTGLGDLIVTCESRHSRNRRAGVLIGQGKSMQEAMDEVQMVVEGVYSARAGKQLADKYGVRMPIIEEVNRILFEGKPAADAVMDLMCRDKTAEHPDLKWE
ncbi:MAG: NAD(P)H-dependent glycerol-3-phosphate dehydrogenase [Eubacteriales bacterium]|nr:NAD(P)H-dependent glycerol-3-phosphate dehydrogenase [Eubacteriales bacterium]